jgi:hypothetical protein
MTRQVTVITRLDRVNQFSRALMMDCKGSGILGDTVEPGGDGRGAARRRSPRGWTIGPLG